MYILLVNPIIRGSKPPFYFPLGLGYIARVLLNDGHKVEILDINAHRLTREETTDKLKASKFDLVGLTGLVTEYSQIKWLASQFKEFHPDVITILGGGLATLAPELVLKKLDIDIVVIGEGEETIKDLVNAIERRNTLSNVDGIWFKKNGEIYRNNPRKIIGNLDDIPFPARELFPLEKYLNNPNLSLFNNKLRTTQIITTRGCPYGCIYCFKGMWGQKFRKRSAENIIDEIRILRDRFDIKGIQIADDLFILDKKRVHDFCDKLIEEKLDITWVANGRVNLIDRLLLRKMRSAGCRVICYGIESGNQGILDTMNKGVTVIQAEKAVQDTWKERILPHGYLMIGMFGENEMTIKDTVDFCNRNGLIGQFSFVTPILGTEMFETAKKIGKLTENEEWLLEHWGEWNDRILINLTDMSDSKLIALKRKGERDILFGNIINKFLLHMKVMSIKNMISGGLIKSKEWLSKDYKEAV